MPPALSPWRGLAVAGAPSQAIQEVEMGDKQGLLDPAPLKDALVSFSSSRRHYRRPCPGKHRGKTVFRRAARESGSENPVNMQRKSSCRVETCGRNQAGKGPFWECGGLPPLFCKAACRRLRQKGRQTADEAEGAASCSSNPSGGKRPHSKRRPLKPKGAWSDYDGGCEELFRGGWLRGRREPIH